MVNHRRRRRPNVSWSARVASIRREVYTESLSCLQLRAGTCSWQLPRISGRCLASVSFTDAPLLTYNKVRPDVLGTTYAYGRLLVYFILLSETFRRTATLPCAPLLHRTASRFRVYLYVETPSAVNFFRCKRSYLKFVSRLHKGTERKREGLEEERKRAFCEVENNTCL